MTREHFLSMLRSPSVIDLNRVKDLEEIAGQFPYFQNAHMLLARQYYGHENIRYESYLKKAAVYAVDRKVLYNLIHLPATEVVHMGTPEQPVFADADDERKTSETELIADSVVEPPAVVSEPTAEPVEPETEDARNVLEQRLRELNRKEEVPPTPVYELPSDTPVVVNPEKEIKPIPATAEITKQPAIKPKEPAPSEARMSFRDWLKIKSVPVAPVSEMKDFFSEALAHGESLPVQADKPEPESIIERFIKTEPRIEPSKSEFYSPGNMARKSLIEHDDMISETLAGIYAKQGNRQKAIETYHKLSLKFPEKSGYFATLVKKLEEEG